MLQDLPGDTAEAHLAVQSRLHVAAIPSENQD